MANMQFFLQVFLYSLNTIVIIYFDDDEFFEVLKYSPSLLFFSFVS